MKPIFIKLIFINRRAVLRPGGTMAATPKGPQKMRLDFNVDRQTYDIFIRACAQKGYAPQVVLERLMARFNQTGQL
jgi:hypothetical protein